MDKAVLGILYVLDIYRLVTGKWPEDTPELRQAISESLDRAEEKLIKRERK